MSANIHESLNGVIDNGDGAFTITRAKLIALVQGKAFLDVYDAADVDESDSGMMALIITSWVVSTSRHGDTQSIRLMRSRASRAPDADCATYSGIGFPRGRHSCM